METSPGTPTVEKSKSCRSCQDRSSAPAGRAELTGLQDQTIDFSGDETGALIGRGCRRMSLKGQHWQVRGQLADLELGLRQPGLERRVDAAEVICRLAITAGRKQPVLTRLLLLSSLKPNWPSTSMPKPTVPSV